MKYFLSLLLIITCNTYAGWSNSYGTVTDIWSHNGSVIIDTELTDDPCGEGKKGFWWPISDSDSQIMLSLSLTAQTAGKKISVVYDPGAPECLYGRAKITHLRLRSD